MNRLRWLWATTALLVFSITLTSGVANGDDAAVDEPEISADEREHWAFLPLRSVPVPEADDTGWCRSPIDRFILAELQRSGLMPSPAADRKSLLRRLSFDLTGLPPTIEQLEAFEQDASPGAYQRQVERLLASPEYGKKWAQHWLDLARFAESDGFEHDKVRADAWKYRDWVVGAFNRDLPYDQFVARQIAGDLLDDGHETIATAFGLSGPDMPDINDQFERRHQLLNELTSTVGSVFLGLQFGCAQCHDHKFDPISQADFYRLRAVFEPAIPRLRLKKPCLTLASKASSKPARIWLHGDFNRPGPVVSPAIPRIATESDHAVALGKLRDPRLDFLDALFDEGNPLTQRVIVNRIWQHHFGVGIYDSPSDVGVMMAGPTHPELLDWLASEIRRANWSLKHLHRLIVTSATYRQTSRRLEDDPLWQQRLEQDPKNRLLSRFTRRRLEGETIRDAMLAVSGLMSDQGGGPSALPPLPAEMRSTLLKGQWETSFREAQHHRRSIYVFARRNLRFPMFDVFDRPDAGASCARRSESTTATQSLQLFNSEFSWRVATALARRVAPNERELVTDPARVLDRLYRVVLSRSPRDQEMIQLQRFLSDTPSSAHHRLAPLCLALINTNEFLTLD